MFSRSARHPCWRVTVGVCVLGCGLTVEAQEVRLQNREVAWARYGASVSFSGPYLVIGEDGGDPRGSRSGAVHVMVQTEAGWQRSVTVRPSGESLDGRFGIAVVLDGRDLIVGEPQYSAPLRFSGRVNVFRLGEDRVTNDGQVLQVANASLGQIFGKSAAIGGGWLAIGAPGASTPAGTSGAVSLFVRDDGQWKHDSDLRPPDGADGDSFGGAVVIRDGLMAVGAPGHRGGGKVYVYRRRDGRWRETARLAPGPDSPMAEYGAAMALTGELLIVGAPLSSASGFRGGAADVWRLSGNRPERLGTLTPAAGFPDGRFGAAIAFDGRTIAVGAPDENSMGLQTGSVHLFQFSDGRVEPASVRLAAPTGSAGDHFGAAVSVDGARLAVGAPDTRGGVGAVYVYALDEVMDTERIQFELVAHPRDGMAGTRVNSIVKDARGQLLVGTLEGGIESFDGRRFAWASEPERRMNVLATRVDHRGLIWFGTEKGIFRLDRAARRQVPYELAHGTTRPEPVVAIFEARDGTVWTGTNGRLYAYVDSQDRFFEYAAFAGPPTEFGEEYISGIQQDSSGRIWVLAKNLRENHASLYAIDTASATVNRYPMSSDWGQLGPMLIDSRDRLWLKAAAPLALPAAIGTVSPTSAVVDASHWAILEDRSGAVWLGTEDGIYRAAADEAVATLQRIAPWAAPRRPWDFTRSLYEEPGGIVLVGTNAGIYRARPGSSLARPAPASAANLVVTSVEITGRDGTREEIPYDQPDLMLSPRDYRMEFHFALLEYGRPNVVAYRYRLEGFDREWVEAGEQGSALYTDLRPGDYTFRAQALPDTRSVTTPIAELAIDVRIQRLYWQTWWFRGGWLLVAAAAAGGAWRYRQSRHLEMERLRLRIAGDLHDDLSTNLSGIALLAERVAGRDTLDESTSRSVGKIHATARDMLEDLRDLVWLVDPSHDSAEGLMLKMRSVAENLLGDRFSLQAEGVPSLHRLRMAERRELLLIYKELLHNAARHAQADEVRVGLRVTADSLRLTVADDGIGFDPTTVTAGHGLHSMQQRAQRLGGELTIDSAPGSGTTAVFSRTF